MARVVLPTAVGSIVAPPQDNPLGYDAYVLGYDGQWYADQREPETFYPGIGMMRRGVFGDMIGWYPVDTEEVEEYILDEGFRDIQLLSDVIPE